MEWWLRPCGLALSDKPVNDEMVPSDSFENAVIPRDALEELLDGAVERICSRQKRDLESAMSALQAEIARIQQALDPARGAGQQSWSRDASANACTVLVQNGSPHADLPQRSADQKQTERLFACNGKAPRDAPKEHAVVPQSTAGDRDAMRDNLGRRTTLSRFQSFNKSKHGYSAAHVMELLSGGESSFQNEVSHSFASTVLFVFVIISVLVSTLALGLSFDVHPTSSFWVVLEIVCVLIFVVEFVAKVTILEKNTYFCGPALAQQGSQKNLRNWKRLERRDREAWINSFWNWFDCGITAIAVIDLCVSLSGYESRSFSMSMLRCFRLFRALRIVKLLRVPLLKDLMNIFFGLILGTPLLVGAFCLLASTVYLAAIIFRLMFGPSSGDGEQCPFDESMTVDLFLETCPGHQYYVYKYFGTMDKSMFTIFRCLTLDCSTSNGLSLVAVLSQGYGLRFNLAWATLTTWVMCGILNIIMASFVGKTTAQIEARESSFVQDRLRALAKEVREYAREHDLKGLSKENYNCTGAHSAEEKQDCWPRRGEIMLSLNEFEQMINGQNRQSKAVKKIIQELGMSISAQDLFHVLDMDESGSVDAVEMLDSLMMLSSIQKAGTLSTLIALHGLGGKLNEISSSNGNSSSR